MTADGSAFVGNLPRRPVERFLAGMRRAELFTAVSWVASIAMSAVACLQQVSTGTGTNPAATAPPAASGTKVPSGTGCAIDPRSGVTLCQQTSVCASVSVDQGTLPGCGFRLQPGSVLDLECVCGNDLCPIGTPATCDEASSLLSSATSLVVCELASQGRCVRIVVPDAGFSGAAAPPSTCNKTCESECAGAPDCVQLCGC